RTSTSLSTVLVVQISWRTGSTTRLSGCPPVKLKLVRGAGRVGTQPAGGVAPPPVGPPPPPESITCAPPPPPHAPAPNSTAPSNIVSKDVLRTAPGECCRESMVLPSVVADAHAV